MYDFSAQAQLPASFSLQKSGTLVGFIPRNQQSRVRFPVYLAPESADLSLKAEMATMTVFPRMTMTRPPGMAMLLPHQQEVLMLSLPNRRDEGFTRIMSSAVQWALRYQLLVWDARQWREDILAFSEHPVALELAALPVGCLRSTLEVRGIDAETLGEACLTLQLPEPGYDLLAYDHLIAQVWQKAREMPVVHGVD